MPQGSSWNSPRLTIPVGETAVVEPPAGFKLSDTAAEGLDAAVAGKSVSVKATAPGRYSLGDLEVVALPRAAQFPASVQLPVFGNYSWLAALQRQLPGFLEPGAIPEQPIVIKPGVVRLSARGPELITSARNVTVDVLPRSQAPEPAGVLVLSNRPEKITAPGLLLKREVPLQGPVRLMVHHRLMPDQPARTLFLRLRNSGNTPLKAVLDLHLLGPSQDEIYVGHLALSRFLDSLKGGSLSGWQLNLEPGQDRVVEQLVMKPGQTASGYGIIHALQGERLEVVVGAVADDEPLQEQEIDVTGLPERTARGVFPAFLDDKQQFTAGGRHLFFALGDKPWVSDPGTGEASPGNFGVVQRLTVTMRNPLPVAREVRLEASARGGPGRAFVRLDGELFETKLLGQMGYPLRKWVLEPGQEREVAIESLAQAGSNYPIELVFGDYQAPSQPPANPTGTPFGPLP